MENSDSYFEIAELITKFLEGRLSSEEAKKLTSWIKESEEHQKIWERLTDKTYLENNLKHWRKENHEPSWKLLEKHLFEKKSKRWKIVLHQSMRYAAILLPALLLLGAGWYLMSPKGGNRESNQPIAALSNVHIVPKGKVAKLVLGNGQVIQLTDSLKEALIEKDGTNVKNQGSTLHYLATLRQDQDEKDKVIYNTLITPRGGEYKIVLADGTKVWLNAASSLRYPTQFNGRDRQVYLSGEAYFEVAEDAHQPFVVRAGKMDITVLGTRFNITAYADDSRQVATLAEGAVRVHYENGVTDNNGIILKPGYKAVVTKSSNKIRVRKANVKAALAWKNGLFIFNGETLGHIMRSLARWYDVEIKYGSGVDTLLHFTGRIDKYENITGILEKLEMTRKVRFKVTGHKVMVVPYQRKTEIQNPKNK